MLVVYADALLQMNARNAVATGRFDVHNDEHILLDEGYTLEEDSLPDLDEPVGNQLMWDNVHSMDLASVLEYDDIPASTEYDDIFYYDEITESVNSDVDSDDLKSEWSYSECFHCDQWVSDWGFASPNSVPDSLGGGSVPDSDACEYDFLV